MSIELTGGIKFKIVNNSPFPFSPDPSNVVVAGSIEEHPQFVEPGSEGSGGSWRSMTLIPTGPGPVGTEFPPEIAAGVGYSFGDPNVILVIALEKSARAEYKTQAKYLKINEGRLEDSLVVEMLKTAPEEVSLPTHFWSLNPDRSGRDEFGIDVTINYGEQFGSKTDGRYATMTINVVNTF